jgi:putative FmdB family regulatory protein
MPTYEYLCQKCEREFEVEQRITDAPIRSCPSCRSRKVKRLISRTSFVLKGGGWYSDLYASPGSKKSEEPAKAGDSAAGAAAEKSAPAEGARPSEAGVESKPAATEPSPSSSGSEPEAGARSAGQKRSKGAKAAA